jgi:hypothetical protein
MMSPLLVRPSRNVAVSLRDTAPSCGPTRQQNCVAKTRRDNWRISRVWLVAVRCTLVQGPIVSKK